MCENGKRDTMDDNTYSEAEERLDRESGFRGYFRAIQQKTHATAVEKGWWDDTEAYGSAVEIAYFHADLSEALDMHRKGKWKLIDDKKPSADPKHRYVAQKIALVHSEISEALVGYLNPSDKIEGFTSMEEELADAVIRMMDIAEHYGWDLADAILAKMEYNKGRPHMHGGKKF